MLQDDDEWETHVQVPIIGIAKKLSIISPELFVRANSNLAPAAVDGPPNLVHYKSRSIYDAKQAGYKSWHCHGVMDKPTCYG
jgi:hypothetical protein